MCDCFTSDSDKPEVTEAVATINEEMNSVDNFTVSMLYATLDNAIATRDKGLGFESIAIEFPAPYSPNDESQIDLNCFAGDVPAGLRERYQIPKIDEYYGDLGLFDDVCFYGKYSNGLFASNFNEDEAPPLKLDWDSKALGIDEVTFARNYFQGTIASSLYAVDDINRLQRDEKGNAPEDNEYLANKQLNDWEEVDINELKNRNQVLSALLSDTFEGRDKENLWLTLIAFTGYGSHRTSPYSSNTEHSGAYFVNDVTFLDGYQVRDGYEKYGAAAYFDQKYQLIEIYLSHSNTTYKSPDLDDSSDINEWRHARWAWKVSLSVAIFIVDNMCHTRFREVNGLIRSITTYLSESHPLRRLLLPFTLGSAYANRVYNEFLRPNGIYHRCFAFKYAELQRLIRESMEDAPAPEKGKRREKKDKMKYRFRLLRKQVLVMKKLPDSIYPIYTDVYDFWVQTMTCVTEYMDIFYNANQTDESLLEADQEVVAFYDSIKRHLGIGDRYRLKKFNIINILTHFICKATVWQHHLNGAMSFEYSMDVDFTGSKIIGNNAKHNNISSYVEYLLLVLSQGWKNNNLLTDKWTDAVLAPPNLYISNINIDQKMIQKAKKVFDKYFNVDLKNQSDTIKVHNRERIAPFYAIDPKYCQSSTML